MIKFFDEEESLISFNPDTIKWIATVITLAGALCVSFKVEPLNIILLNLGSFLFFVWGIMIKEKAMICVNGGLLSIYMIGFFLRFS